MSRFIVFDVDGTLMDLTHRRKFLETQPKDWDSFWGGGYYSEHINKKPFLRIHGI